MLKRILGFNFLPGNTDAALLALRICAFVSLFLKHGYEKIFTFSEVAKVSADPLHIGHVPSLIFAMVGDGICSVLVVIGFATRIAALYEFVIIFVAWALWHHFAFFGHNNPTESHGELIWMYLASLITVLLAGPGKYSVDSLLKRNSAVSHRVPGQQVQHVH